MVEASYLKKYTKPRPALLYAGRLVHKNETSFSKYKAR